MQNHIKMLHSVIKASVVCKNSKKNNVGQDKVEIFVD